MSTTSLGRSVRSLASAARAALAALAVLASASTVPAQRPAAPRLTPPTLVVLVAVDQLRGDYLDRWPGQLTGGLGRIRASSIYFRNARQNHALTETAPGHASMLSGRWPSHTAIWSNDAGVPDPATHLLGGATKTGASPMRFVGTTLYDWMRARDPDTQVLSVSRKDRAAILPVGRARGAVFWWAEGRFTTSSYYADTLPGWLRDWNASVRLDAFAGRSWTPLLPATAYAEPDDAPWENGGTDRTFPHVLPAAGAKLSDALERTPWMDSLTLDVALRGVQATRIGQRDGHTDLLSVSLSSTDAIGHAFGPDSREIHDQVVRLDRMLGAFLDGLAGVVPRERMLLVLTADHGILSLPELAVAGGRDAGRIDLATPANALEQELEARWGMPFGISGDNGLVTADVGALGARGLSVDSLADVLARRIAARPGVAGVYGPARLRAAPPTDAAAGRWRHTLAPSVGWLVAAVAKPGWVFSDSRKAEHGTNQPETMHVPIAFLLPNGTPRTIDRPVDTVDIAPTLAAWLGVRPTERVDGVVLPEVVR